MQYDFDTVISRIDTRSEKWDGLEQRFGTKDVLPMWVADMDFMSPPPVIEALRQRVEHGVYGYTIRTDSYFEAIVNWLQRRHQWNIEKEWIAHSPGVVPALSLIISTFAKPGDKVLIQSPVYHHFAHSIQAQGRIVQNNPLNLANGRYTMDFDNLEANIDDDVKLMILCNPHNPVGRVWTREELAKLGQICMRHNILVVSDEIHCDIVYKNHTHIPFASISEEIAQNSMTCIAPSKTFNLLGLQTSSIIIPNQRLREEFNQAMDRLSLCSPNLFGVVALEAAYRDGEDWLNQLLNYLEGNVDYLLQYIAEHLPQLRATRPEGTYLIWLDCRNLGLSMSELDKFMLQKARIALNEGYIFGGGGEGFMRMNIACPRSVLKQCLRQLSEAVGTLVNS